VDSSCRSRRHTALNIIASETRPLLVYTYKRREWEPLAIPSMMNSMQPLNELSIEAAQATGRSCGSCALTNGWRLSSCAASAIFGLALLSACLSSEVAWCQGALIGGGPPRSAQPGRRDPAETQAYTAAVSEPNLNVRISAIQQFLVNYPQSTLRQPAIAQLLEAQKENRAAGGAGAPAPFNRVPVSAPKTIPPAPTSSAAAPVEAPAAARDSLLQQPAKHAEIKIEPHSLSIKADNSALSEILHDIASSTGMKLDGLTKDERIFGSYGPGETHEVLLSLLQGSGYNVVMVGDVDDGRAPREMTLSQRTASATPTASAPTANNADEDADDEQEVQQAPPENPLPGRPNLGNQPIPNEGAPPRTPQQILQDLQRQRQQDPNQPLPPQQ
jgi:hypothetical protein